MSGYLEEQEIAARRLVGSLNPDEFQVLVALVRGLSAKDVAAATGLDIVEVESARVSMMTKLGAARTADAVRIGVLARVDLMN